MSEPGTYMIRVGAVALWVGEATSREHAVDQYRQGWTVDILDPEEQADIENDLGPFHRCRCGAM